MKELLRPLVALLLTGLLSAQDTDEIGREVSGYIPTPDSEVAGLSIAELLERGKIAFSALWTHQEGGGRPMTGGTGNPLANPQRRLDFPLNFNRVSAMDSNGCAGCHNAPFGVPGGGGDFVTGVFVAAQRFDAASFDPHDAIPRGGAFDELGQPVTLATIGNYRATIGMFGSGYIEMLARQITTDLQAARDALAPGQSTALSSKGISFGILSRALDGAYDVSQVEGLPVQALRGNVPSLVIRPFHQSGSVVSLREFTNNAFNHHHGMQAVERFDDHADPDGDGHYDELSRGDITAVTVYQAALAAPGQVVPNNLRVEEAIYNGGRLFEVIGCASCHLPALPLDDRGWIYTEPNPYNPPGNAQFGDIQTIRIDLSSRELPGPRLQPDANGVVWVPAFTDLKLHDITTGAPDDPNREGLDINQPGGSEAFFGGNSRFLTKKLWGAANERPYFHHGKFTTLREATLAHYGEAEETRTKFLALSGADKNAVIEFLKSLQILPRGTSWLVVDENGAQKKGWPPQSFFSWRVSHAGR
jgi:hypothetical protein